MCVKHYGEKEAEQAFLEMCATVSRFPTPEDTHDLSVMCLSEEHARSVLEGTKCSHCNIFRMRKRCGMWDRHLLFAARVLEVDMVGDNDESVSTWSSQPASPAYGEMLEVMAHAAKRLDLQADLLRDLDEGGQRAAPHYRFSSPCN